MEDFREGIGSLSWLALSHPPSSSPSPSLSYYPISSLLSSILFVHSHTKCEDKRWDNEEKGKRWKGVWVPEPSFLSGSSLFPHTGRALPSPFSSLTLFVYPALTDS